MNKFSILPASPTPQMFDMNAIARAPRLGERTKQKYQHEVDRYIQTGAKLTDSAALESYAEGLKSSRRSFFKAALRIMTLDFEKKLKANASPDNLFKTQAALLRIEAIRSTVTVVTHKGSKAHNWLSQKQVTDITALCPTTLEGRRDWLVLGLLLGAGLRREELVSLRFDALKEQPMKSGKMRTVLEVTGKGVKTRVIPIKAILAERISFWRKEVGAGLIIRARGDKKHTLTQSISTISVFHIVRKYGAKIDRPKLAPHDLRRTFAQLAFDAGVPITQICTLLGHESVSTTQKYLNLAIDLEVTASDFIPLSE